MKEFPNCFCWLDHRMLSSFAISHHIGTNLFVVMCKYFKESTEILWWAMWILVTFQLTRLLHLWARIYKTLYCSLPKYLVLQWLKHSWLSGHIRHQWSVVRTHTLVICIYYHYFENTKIKKREAGNGQFKKLSYYQ